jgi:hypothetical protein
MSNPKADYLRDNEKKFASEMAAKRGVTTPESGDKNRGTPKGNYADKEIKGKGK